MATVFEKLIELASDWRDFSREANGRKCKTYCHEDGSEAAWCYFDDMGDHCSVTIKSKNGAYHCDEVAFVSFFSNPSIGSLTTASLANLKNEITKSRAALEWNKRQQEKISSEQKESERLAAIKRHREALERLESEEQSNDQ